MDADSLDAGAFGTVTREVWLKLVDRALKGADFRQALVSASDDGIAIEPLYDRRAGASPLLRRRPASPWIVTQRMDDPDIDRALLQLDDDLANGATGIDLVFRASGAAFGAGLDDSAADLPARLAAALAGRTVSLRLDGASAGFAQSLAAALAGQSSVILHCGLDMIAAETSGDAILDGLRRLRETGAAGTALNADGRAVHNAGGTEAQELAVMAASLAHHLRLMDAAAIGPQAVLAATSLCLAADQDQFVTTAKARAARRLFARIAEACGVEAPPAPHLFMETSYRMLTRLDPETNLLRNTIAVFAAGTGCADEICVLPHTLAHGIPDPLARRLARNMQTILIAESHLDHVCDPAAGAGGIEALTDALAGTAWEIFTGIERDGGLTATIASGRLAAMVAEARANRPAKPIVGTTLFPAKTERPVSVLGPLAETGDGIGLRPARLDDAGGA